jgi:hypothetical protein
MEHAAGVHAAAADRSIHDREEKRAMSREETRVERTGIEPVTSSLQSWRSPS